MSKMKFLLLLLLTGLALACDSPTRASNVPCADGYERVSRIGYETCVRR